MNPFSFTMHVIKAPHAIAGRCQICKSLIAGGETIITHNGHQEISWLFTIAHVDCFKKIIDPVFTPLLSQDVFCTPMVGRSGPRVEINIGGKYNFHLEPSQAYNLAVSLVMSSVASSFDYFVWDLMTENGLEPLPILQKIQTLRSQKTIADVSVVGTPEFLFEDCWATFRKCVEERYGSSSQEFLAAARVLFDRKFPTGTKDGDRIQ